MLDFGYSRPNLEDEVLRELSDPDTMAIAGGTELLNWMRLGIASPQRVVDLAALPDRSSIVIDGEWLEIGAACTLNINLLPAAAWTPAYDSDGTHARVPGARSLSRVTNGSSDQPDNPNKPRKQRSIGPKEGPPSQERSRLEAADPIVPFDDALATVSVGGDGGAARPPSPGHQHEQ